MPIPDRDGVVLGHRALRLDREHLVQVFPLTLAERRPLLPRPLRELPIELRDVVLAQKAVGLLQSADPRQPQLLWQTVLPGAESIARPTCVSRVLSTASPAFGVRKNDFPGRYTTRKIRPVSRSLRKANITARVDSSSTNCA